MQFTRETSGLWQGEKTPSCRPSSHCSKEPAAGPCPEGGARAGALLLGSPGSTSVRREGPHTCRLSRSSPDTGLAKGDFQPSVGRGGKIIRHEQSRESWCFVCSIALEVSARGGECPCLQSELRYPRLPPCSLGPLARGLPFAFQAPGALCRTLA